MKLKVYLVLGFSSVFFFLMASAGQARIVNLAILHTNDTQGRIESFYFKSSKPIGGYAKRAIFFAEKRRHQKLYWLTLDAGNIFGLAPYSYFLQGALDVKLMSWAKYDAGAVGPMDFIFGREVLERRIKEASFPFLCANIVDEATGRYLGEPFRQVEFDGFRVALLGVASGEIPSFYAPEHLKGLKFKDPVQVVSELVPQLKGTSDAIILLSTLSLSENISLANSFPEISVIVSGGEEAELEVPIKVGDTLIVQAGKWGANVGLLKLTFEGERDTGFKLRFFDETLEPMNGRWVENTKYLAEIASHRGELEEEWSKVVGKITNDMRIAKVLSFETEIGDLFADAVRDATQTQVCLIESGAFRAGLSKGAITRGDIYRAYPGDSFVVTGKISGENLIRMLEDSAKQIGKGGFLQVSGVRFGIFGGEVFDVSVGGAPIDRAGSYTIALTSTLLKGIEGIRAGSFLEEPRVHLDMPVRVAVEKFLEKKGEFGNQLEERISYYAEKPAVEEVKPEEAKPEEARPEEVTPTQPQEEVVPEGTGEAGGAETSPPSEGKVASEGGESQTAPAGEVPSTPAGGEQPAESTEFQVKVVEEADTGLPREEAPEAQPVAPSEEEAPEGKTIGGVKQVFEDVEFEFKVLEKEFEGAKVYEFSLTLRNKSEGMKLFSFPTSQLYDFAVYEDKKLVWNFAYNRYFIQAEKSFSLAPYEEKAFSVYWDGLTNAKTKLERKLYTFSATLKSTPERHLSFVGLFEPMEL